jgi:hypothetical protein
MGERFAIIRSGIRGAPIQEGLRRNFFNILF